jgi:hypothetical protein
VLTLALVFTTSQNAEGFFFHHPHAYSVVPVTAAPAIPFNIVQGVQLFQLLLHELGQSGDGSSKTGTATLPPVPQDVVATIKRVDDALPGVVDKINALSDLNPKYKDKISVGQSSTSGNKSGPPK